MLVVIATIHTATAISTRSGNLFILHRVSLLALCPACAGKELMPPLGTVLSDILLLFQAVHPVCLRVLLQPLPPLLRGDHFSLFGCHPVPVSGPGLWRPLANASPRHRGPVWGPCPLPISGGPELRHVSQPTQCTKQRSPNWCWKTWNRGLYHSNCPLHYTQVFVFPTTLRWCAQVTLQGKDWNFTSST